MSHIEMLLEALKRENQHGLRAIIIRRRGNPRAIKPRVNFYNLFLKVFNPYF